MLCLQIDFDNITRVLCFQTQLYVIEMPEAKAKPDEAVV